MTAVRKQIKLEEDEDAAQLKFPNEFKNADALLISEVHMLLKVCCVFLCHDQFSPSNLYIVKIKLDDIIEKPMLQCNCALYTYSPGYSEPYYSGKEGTKQLCSVHLQSRLLCNQ